jgi:hypothetical protein
MHNTVHDTQWWNTYNVGRGQTTWREMSNEMTKIRDDMLIWGLTSAGENALERRDGDAGVEKIARDTGGKGVGISARMWG